MTRVTSLSLCAACVLVAQTVDDGIRAFHEGRYADAVKMLAPLRGEPVGKAFHAIALAASGQCKAAEPDLREALRQSGAAKRFAGLALTQCLIARKDYDAAAPVLAALRQDFPKDADVLYETARVHMRAWDEAVADMFRNAPASFRVNQLSAEVFETQSRFSEAASEYRKAIDKSPATLNLHYRLGRALLLESHDPKALATAQKEFEAELSLNPNDAAAEYQIGQILIARQQPVQAAKRFEKAYALSPDFPEAYVARAKLHMDAKQYNESLPLLRKAVELQPALESAHYSLMLAYRNLGRSTDALKEKAELDRLQKPPEGEFTEFLKKLGEKPKTP